MAFGEALQEIKESRGFSMREFPDTSPSQIYNMLNKGHLPSQEKLEVIIGHLGDVATSQGSERGPIEALQLREAWLADHLVRLGVVEEITPVLAKLAYAEPVQQAAVISAINA